MRCLRRKQTPNSPVAHTQEEVNPIITITDLEREISELRKALDDEHNDALLTNERLEEALKAKEGQMQDLRDEEGAKVARLTAEVAELVGARTRLEEHVAALEREQRSRRTASNEEMEALRQQVASVEAQRVEAEAKAAALTAKVTALSSERERVKLQLELERDMNRRPMTGTTVRETALQKDLDIARRAVAELEADVAEAAARVADLEQTNEALTRNLEQSRLDGLGVNDLNWQRAVQLEDINRQLKKALDEALTSNGHHIIATSNHGEHVTALREENAALKAQNQQLTQALNDAGAAAAARAADPAAPAAPAVEQKTGESLGEEDGGAATQLRAQLAAVEQQNRRLRDALADAVASGGQPAVSTAAVAATDAADVEALRRSLAEADSRNHELAAASARAEEAATALKTELAARNEELQALSAAMDETKQENDDLSMKLESIGYGKIGAPAQQAAGPRGIAGPAAASGAFAHKAQSKASPGSGVKSPSADGDVDTAADAKQEPPDDNDVNVDNDKKTIRDLQMQMQDRHQAYCTDVVALRKKADEAAAARDAAATRAEELLAALHKAEHDLMSVHHWQEVAAAAEEMERVRVAGLRAVDASLTALAEDPVFQARLKMPTVQTALKCWLGGPAARLSDAEMARVQSDPAVQDVYPSLKALDELCLKVEVKFPLDHIAVGKTQLCQEAIRWAYGPDFLARHASARPKFADDEVLFLERRLAWVVEYDAMAGAAQTIESLQQEWVAAQDDLRAARAQLGQLDRTSQERAAESQAAATRVRELERARDDAEHRAAAAERRCREYEQYVATAELRIRENQEHAAATEKRIREHHEHVIGVERRSREFQELAAAAEQRSREQEERAERAEAALSVELRKAEEARARPPETRDDKVLALLQHHVDELTACAKESEAAHSRALADVQAEKVAAEQRATDLAGQLKEAQKRLKEAEERASHQAVVKSPSPAPAPEGPAFLRRELTAAKDAVKKETDARVKAEKERAEAEAKLATAQAELADAQAKLAAAKAQADDSQAQALASQSTKSQADADVHAKLTKAQSRIDELLSQSAKSHQAMVALEQDLEAVVAAKTKLEARLARLDTADTPSSPAAKKEKAPKAAKAAKGDGVSTDRARAMQLKAINTHLKGYATDAAFQQALQRPMVRRALKCWSGASRTALTDAEAAAIRADTFVQDVYARLKELEVLCVEYGVHFPIEAVMRGEAELSADVVSLYASADVYAARSPQSPERQPRAAKKAAAGAVSTPVPPPPPPLIPPPSAPPRSGSVDDLLKSMSGSAKPRSPDSPGKYNVREPARYAVEYPSSLL